MTEGRLQILVLGGTAWLGRQLSREALERGHSVCCLARGDSGPVADGARLVVADRRLDGAYDEVCRREWDAVVDLAWQPGLVISALAALASRAGLWIYVSSASVYSSHEADGADERSGLLEATTAQEVGMELYGEAKVACELACRVAAGSELLIARPGLIAGPGDPSDRAGYWIARSARDPRTPMLVPHPRAPRTQVIDVRDLAAWLIECAENRTTGTYDTVGPSMELHEFIDLSRRIAGHTGPVVSAGDQWLISEGVEEFMGPGSLPLWIAKPDMQGFCSRSGAAARQAGLSHRPVSETLSATLEWERTQNLGRIRKAGISPEREAELVRKLADA